MKKIILLFILMFSLVLISCNQTFSITLNSNATVELFIGEESAINATSTGTINYSITSGSEFITLENNVIKAVKEGEAIVTLKLTENVNVTKQVKVIVKQKEVLNPEITIEGATSGKVGEEITLNAKLTNLTGNVYWLSSDYNICKVENGVLTLVSPGVVTISASIGNVKTSIEFTVLALTPTQIEIKEYDKVLDINKTYKLEITTTPKDASKEFIFVSSDENIATVSESGVVKGISGGNATITVKAKDDETVFAQTVIKVKDNVKPEFVIDEEKAITKIIIEQDFDLLTGIKAIDNIDGDITDKITIKGSVDTNKYGKYQVVYSVTDSSGNKANLFRDFEVYWPYSVQFIGHGGSYYGIMNTEEAILYAIRELKYQAIEVDLKQTKDGVFVLCHDNDFGGKDLASTNYDDLKDVVYTSSRNSGYPSQNGSVVNSPYSTKICTLERYLTLCRTYGVKAVVELKSSKGITSSDQSRMGALMDEIKRCGMLENTIILTSQSNCLRWLRNNGYNDMELQYLVNSCEYDSTLDFCKQYNLTVSINTTGNHSNSDEWLAKYKEAGLKISTYTYTQYVNYDVVQKWIDKGVDYVTCDWHIMSKLNLPMPKENLPDYTVTFKDEDGKVLKVSTVKEGETAAPPKDPTKEGYRFVKWDQEFRNVKSNIETKAVYEIINYTITYVDNINVIEKTEFNSKDEFVNELYSDLIDFCETNAGKINGLKKENGKFVLSLNGQTVSFATVQDILDIDIYVFEKTLSNLFYKPVERNSDDTCVIEIDENYFLNSKKYIDKYREMDQYLVKCIKDRYTSYSNTFKPLSDGRIQIFFRFHQWAKGTNIAEFNTLPAKYNVQIDENAQITLPTDNLSYTINDEVTLSNPTSNYKFLGWYLTKECDGEKVEKIEKGSTGNIILYAKWEK